MSVFRLQNNTPQVYQKESRDFQLLSRAMDLIHGSVRADISAIKNLTRPRLIYDSMLLNYASKVGFFPKRSIDAKVLRYILAAFPYIIKNKGTKYGIEQAVITIIKAENNVYDKDEIQVVVDQPTHSIKIGTAYEIYNKNALEELLKYVLPAGYDYWFTSLTKTETPVDIYVESSSITYVTAEPPVSGARAVAQIPTMDDNYEGNAFDTNYEAGDDIEALKNNEAGSYSSNVVKSVQEIEHYTEQTQNEEEQQ